MILLGYTLFSTGFRLQDCVQMPPESSPGVIVLLLKVHTPSTSINNKTTDSPEGLFLKAHHS